MAVSNTQKSKKRYPFVWGKRTVRVRKIDGTYDTKQILSLGVATKAAISDLNLVEPTADQKDGQGANGSYERKLATHGKTVIIPSPTGKKTAKGRIKTYRVTFPSGMSKKQIEAALSATKADSFRPVGGTERTITH